MTRELAGEPRHLQANEELGVKVLLRQANQGPDEEVSGVWAGGILLRKSVNRESTRWQREAEKEAYGRESAEERYRLETDYEALGFLGRSLHH